MLSQPWLRCHALGTRAGLESQELRSVSIHSSAKYQALATEQLSHSVTSAPGCPGWELWTQRRSALFPIGNYLNRIAFRFRQQHRVIVEVSSYECVPSLFLFTSVDLSVSVSLPCYPGSPGTVHWWDSEMLHPHWFKTRHRHRSETAEVPRHGNLAGLMTRSNASHLLQWTGPIWLYSRTKTTGKKN